MSILGSLFKSKGGKVNFVPYEVLCCQCLCLISDFSPPSVEGGFSEEAESFALHRSCRAKLPCQLRVRC